MVTTNPEIAGMISSVICVDQTGNLNCRDRRMPLFRCRHSRDSLQAIRFIENHVVDTHWTFRFVIFTTAFSICQGSLLKMCQLLPNISVNVRVSDISDNSSRRSNARVCTAAAPEVLQTLFLGS
jgi:hypothetical protein